MSLALNTTRYLAVASRSSHDVSHDDAWLVAALARISSASTVKAAAIAPSWARNRRRSGTGSPRYGVHVRRREAKDRSPGQSRQFGSTLRHHHQSRDGRPLI